MTDPNQRMMNWQIKTDTGKVKQILDDMRPEMLKHYEAAVASLCEMETKARQTLNSAGVQTIMYVPHLSYARQLYKLSRQQGISGASFALQAQVLLENGRTAVSTQPSSSESEPRHSMRSHPGHELRHQEIIRLHEPPQPD